MILSLAAAILVYHAAATQTVSSEAGLYPTLQQREFPLFHHTQARTHQGQGVSFAPYKSAGNSASVALVYHQDNPSQATQSYTTVNQQFPTFPFSAQRNRNIQLQSPAASNQIPFASQHGYMILAPLNPITNAGLYLPNINNNNYPQQTQQQNQIALANNVYIPVHHLQAKIPPVVPRNQQKLKSPPERTNQQPSLQINSPLFHHQVYHPLHTSVKQNNNSRPRLSPPPPKIYRNFHAMTPISRRPPPRKNLRKQAEVEEDEEEEDERAQVNESDDDEENENIEEEDEDDDDNSNLKKEENDDYRPYNYHPRYRNHDDDDDGDHDSYHHSETRPKESKLSSGKHIYPKDRQIGKSISGSFVNSFDVQQFVPPLQRESVFPGLAFEHPKPKVEVKMYKYVQSSAPSPSEKDFIEGKGSEIKPVVQQNKKMYHEKWIISSKSSSSSF